MSDIKELSQRSVKRIKINPYLDNFGVFNWSFWWFSMFSSSFIIMSFLLTFIIFIQNLNYLETLGMVQDIMIRIITYFSTSMISGINTLNYLNDLLSFFNITHSNPFNFNVKIINPNLNLGLWVLIVISGFLSLKLQFFTLYQKLYQQDINHLGYYNYYVPFVFLFKNMKRKKNKKLYIRLLDVVKLEKFNPESKSEEQTIRNFLMIFFDIDLEDCNKYKVQIRQKNLFFNSFYNYQIWEVIEKEEDNKKEIKEEREKEEEDDIEEIEEIKTENKKVIL